MNPKECPVCQAPNNGSFDSVFGSFLLVPDDFDSIPDSVLHLFQGAMTFNFCLRNSFFANADQDEIEKKRSAAIEFALKHSATSNLKMKKELNSKSAENVSLKR